MNAVHPSFGRRSFGTPQAAPAAPPDVAATAQASVALSSTPDLPEQAILELRQVCLARLDPAAIAALPVDRLAIDVERLIAETANDRRIQLNAKEQRKLARELVDDIVGLGPLEPLLEDDSISEIMINGPNRLFVERAGRLTVSHVRFRDTGHLINVCHRIAAGAGRRVDESSPMADARLKDGSRVNIVFPPLALDGPYVTIRKFGKKQISFQRLIEWGALTQSVAEILQLGARARLNVIISGGTGSGKTTMMNALSNLIDPGERVVTVEDTAELQLQQPHVVRMETRPPSLEGRGEITQRDLMRNALRMRPDRIIIGEVRGAEAFDMLQAMNTGHDGSMSTIHANNARDALTRIENMVQMGNMGLPSKAIRTQIVGAVDLIVQVERQRDGGRRVTQVTEVAGMDGDVVTMNDVFKLEIQGEGVDGRLIGKYVVNRLPPACQARLNYFGLERAWRAVLDAAQ